MDILEEFFAVTGDREYNVFMIFIAMVLATGLSLIITKVYQLTFTGAKYSQSFVHTIVMMSVIVSVVMNVISSNAGVAFGLFAIFSLIRFRSAVTDAKDIAYIFFGLCVGMTAGLFYFDLAILLTIVASLVFYLLYKLQYGKAKDAQILKVTVPENLNYEYMFDGIFRRHTDNYQLRKVETTNLGTMILYTYAIRCKPNTDDKQLIDEIRERNANLNVSLTYLGEDFEG